MKKPPLRHAFVLEVPLFDLQVLVASRLDVIEKRLGELGRELDRGSECAAFVVNERIEGLVYLMLYCPPGADHSTIAHECSHLADFISDTVGMPLNLSTTEPRAYLVGSLFQGITDQIRKIKNWGKE